MWSQCLTPRACPNTLQRLLAETPASPSPPSSFRWTDALNGREWATVIWASIILAFMLSRADMRGNLWTIARIPFSRVVFPRAALELLYIGAVVLVASRIGAWHLRLIGQTLAWLVASAAVGFFRVTAIPTDPHYFRTAARRSLAITILIDVYVNLFVFPFPVELFLLPLLALLGMLQAVADLKEEFEDVRGCFNAMVGVAGLGLFVFATVHVIKGLSLPNLGHLGESLILPLWLNMALVPFSYLLALQLAYGEAFGGISRAPNASRAAGLRARAALVWGVGARVYSLGQFSEPWPKRLNGATTAGEAREIVASLRAERAAQRQEPGAGSRASRDPRRPSG